MIICIRQWNLIWKFEDGQFENGNEVQGDFGFWIADAMDGPQIIMIIMIFAAGEPILLGLQALIFQRKTNDIKI